MTDSTQRGKNKTWWLNNPYPLRTRNQQDTTMIREPVVKLAGVMARVMGDLEAARADVGRAGVELDMALESPARNPLRQQIVELDQALDAAWRLADALAASLHLSQEEHDAVDAAMAADDFDDEVPIVIAAISAADEGRIR